MSALPKILGRSVLTIIPTLILATLAVFLLQRLIPGDPAQVIAGEYATPERLDEIRLQLGLDRPLALQYIEWVGRALTGDLGTSLRTGAPVTALILERLPTTLTIGAGAMIIAVGIGVPAGVLAASRRGRRLDDLVTGFATLGIAIPNFWLGMILVLIFSLTLGWLPATGFVPLSVDPMETLRYALLPSIALGAIGAAEVCRQLRSAMVETLGLDFIRTHVAKGLSSRSIVWAHALKNSSLPLATVVGLQANRVLSSTVVVEAVFGIAGIGTLVVDATNQRDYPVVQGVVLVAVLLVLAINLIIEISYRLIDPRIK